MKHEIAGLKGQIETLKMRQRLFTGFGLAFASSGIIQGIVHLVSSQPETVFDYLIDGGIFAIGVLSIYTATQYLKTRKIAENLLKNMEKLEEIKAAARRQLRLEETLLDHLGPTIPIIQCVYPEQKNE